MERLEMLEILKRVEICVKKDSQEIAKDLVRLEINKLKGTQVEACQASKCYYWYCQCCSNLSCESNRNR